jgi:demethylspheroidene O-methyltransferase
MIQAGMQAGGSRFDPRLLADRLLASPRFRNWAAAFPLTRPIARRRARALFDLCAGFVYAQVLQACVRLNVFDMLAEGPQSPASLAHRMGLSAAAAEKLLAAAISLKLVAKRGEAYALGSLGAAMVGNPGIAAMVEHHAVLYADLHDPVALLRGELGQTDLSKYWAYATAAQPGGLQASDVGGYTRLMAASQPMIAEEVLSAYRLGRHRRLLDVGGGDGSFVAAAAARNPGLDLVLFDLPAVAERARARFAALGLAGRTQAVGGDFFADSLPEGADVISLVRVVHDHDDDAVEKILRAVHRALPPGGTLLLAEPMAGTAGAEPIGDAYFGFYLLAMGSGRPRTVAEFRLLLGAAGFSAARPVRTRMPLLTRLIVATK